jgi:hypothetical protein
MTSKKEKPIMTVTKYVNYLSSTEPEQLAILNGLSNVNKGRIGVWLKNVEVIKDVDGEPYILSPLCENQKVYTNKDISYLAFYKWCVDKAKLPKPLDDIFYYAYIWKQYPKIDPYTKVDIVVSLNPTSNYVRLYKKIMDELISSLAKKKVLSIEECKKIKDSLPDDHAYGSIILSQLDSRGRQKEKKINYDYLFIAYFIKSKTIKYDIAYQRELRIYLDLAVYDTSPFLYKEGVAYTSEQYFEQDTVVHPYFEFMGAYASNSESEISISSLAKRLCIDISNLQQYMRESKTSKISSDTIDNVHFNLNVLKYCKNIPFENMDREVFKKELLLELLQNKEKITSNQEYDDIYGSIMYHIQEKEGASSNIFDTFISIYNTIVELYRKNYIKDNYDEPQILPKERAKSEGIIRKSSVYIVKPKAFSDGDKRKRSSGTFRYYNNDRDPYTHEDFVDMHLKKQKNVSDIMYDNDVKVFHYRFDTVPLYNYILYCIEKCINPKNLSTNTDLTDANLDEVCKKIKHFTKKPTYDSSKEIRQSINACKKYTYNNFLIIMLFKEMPEEQKEKDIIGMQHIVLYIKLGDISFECFGDDGCILTLPIFSNKPAFADYNKLTKDILKKIEAKISVGELICDKFFPYRRNKKITNLPDFTFELDDDAKKTFEKLKIYNEKIERL